MRVSKARIESFRTFIFSWWIQHRRDLPWRRTGDPYKILVSEIMLQQTQVSRVISKYNEFLSIYPDAGSLAKAGNADIIRIWRGLGYNRRALYLRDAARMVVEKFSGQMPDTEDGLRRLPGVGVYTARAVLVFAYRRDVSMIDTNIRKIITAYFFKGVAQSDAVVADIADRLVPVGKSWEWHQALMDYGALALKKSGWPLPVTKKSQGVPFIHTARFLRGRIVDLLRDGDVKESELIVRLESTTGRDRNDIKSQIVQLAQERLIAVTSGGMITLSEQQ